MKGIIYAIFLTACGGPAFTGFSGTTIDEAGAPSSEGGGTEAGQGGMGESAGGGASSGGMVSTAGQGELGGAGNSGMAGHAGEGISGLGGSISGAPGVSACLASFETNSCAAPCTSREETGCAYVLRCFAQHDSNSIDNCPGYTQTAYQLAIEAERNCC